MLDFINTIGYDSESAVGRKQKLFLMRHQRILLQGLEVQAVGGGREPPQRALAVIFYLETMASQIQGCVALS